MTHQDDCSPDRGRKVKLKKSKNYGSNHGCEAQTIEQASHESGKGSGLSFTRAQTTLARYETLWHHTNTAAHSLVKVTIMKALQLQ